MNRLKASYTIEVRYVLAITLFALSTIIITAYREETRVLLNLVAHTAQEQMLYTDEEYKKDTYNKESITTEGMAYKNISSRFSNAFLSIDEGNKEVTVMLKQGDYQTYISTGRYRPEDFMRLNTLAENRYESIKD